MPLRLAAGAMAGMTATALTHPLDVMRLRLALPQSPYTGGSLVRAGSILIMRRHKANA